MIVSKNDESTIYQARLHWILFVWPILLLIVATSIGVAFPIFDKLSLFVIILALVWEFIVWLIYQSSYLIIRKKQVILCTGIFVRQTLDISLSKIESVDIRQSILGSILQYGSLVITGTGGTRQYINYLSKPLTCRRYIEQVLHD
ncbi:MAG: hypothetical protein A3E88_02965 [Legionellales bacterium RIFCSPHIGHO2_12_FULL_35_11]|nr:MAG: hypothetical protein A3E88_02965 [Legionellales bacterium RIFCSPHIGHO2_12_FULL_35_11]